MEAVEAWRELSPCNIVTLYMACADHTRPVLHSGLHYL